MPTFCEQAMAILRAIDHPTPEATACALLEAARALAWFWSLEQHDVEAHLRSALAGETDPASRLGLVLDGSTVIERAHEIIDQTATMVAAV